MKSGQLACSHVPCAVCAGAVLLEDEPGGQPTFALKER